MSTQALLLPSLIPFPPRTSFDSRRRRFPGARATDGRKRANLVARKKKRVKLPEYADGHGRALSIGEFLHHPSGVEALLNTGALEGFESIGSNTYRCFLQRIQFLMLEVAPVLELRVIPTSEDCTVEMLSCRDQTASVPGPARRIPAEAEAERKHMEDLARLRFEGSESMKRQNDLFSAFMRNHITWEMNGSETFLDVHVDLSLSLEVFTQQFSLLPISAVEKPGNLVMQGLLDRYVPLLAEQLLKDYAKWVHRQLNLFP